MTAPPVPDAVLYLSSHCPHCPTVLQALVELVKTGAIGRLEVINLVARPELAAAGVRSVPWVRLGEFELGGVRGQAELADWARRAASPDGLTDYFHDQLKAGALSEVVDLVRRRPATLPALLPLIANPAASLNVRAGAGAVFEELAGSAALREVVAELGELTRHADPRVRIDACHLLSFSSTAAARPWLSACLDDVDAEVREIAAESLAALADATDSGRQA